MATKEQEKPIKEEPVIKDATHIGEPIRKEQGEESAVKEKEKEKERVVMTNPLLKRIHEVIWDKSHYHIGDKIELEKGLIVEMFEGANKCRAILINDTTWMEQNTNTATKYAAEVRDEGYKTTWGIRQGNKQWGLIRQNRLNTYFDLTDGDTNFIGKL